MTAVLTAKGLSAGYADRGVRQAWAKAPDKDKHRLSAQVNRTEKLASKIKITERMPLIMRPSGPLALEREPRGSQHQVVTCLPGSCSPAGR